MVGNDNALAQALQEEGIPVYDLRSDKTAPYSLSPHVWVDCEKMGWDAESAVQHLYQDAGIVVNTLFLAHGGADSTGAKGLRLGTTEVTRLGMRAAEMREIAKLIALSFDRNGDCGRIRQAAVELRQRFPEPEFCIQIQEAE
jgi:glycine hydroxymethyltransferase